MPKSGPQTKRMPAVGAAGWFVDDDNPSLLATRCTRCASIEFPPQDGQCPNPGCAGSEKVVQRLSRTGTVWSVTVARYQPPPPFVATSEPFEPFAIAAVEIDDESIVVMGQLSAEAQLGEARLGSRVELVVEPLFVDEEGVEHTIWKWRPTPGGPS